MKYKNQAEYVKQWRKRHRSKQRIYNCRSDARRYINKYATPSDLRKLIMHAQTQLKHLAQK